MLQRPQTRTSRTPALTRLLVPAAFALLGCPNEDLAPLEPCTVSGVSDDIPVSGVDKVDLLFVIDNSKSMAEEQAKLALQLPKLVTTLTTGKLDDGDDMQDFQPVSDLHLAVVTSDMGGSGTNIQIRDTCVSNNHFGDDGIFQHQSRASSGDCVGFALTTARYLQFQPSAGGTTADQVAHDFGCLAAVGVGGCGFEQQLEAMYKALAPNTVAFANGTVGHGSGPGAKNAGFLRDDGVLAIIHVSDEEDCSITDTGADLFIPLSENPNIQLPSGSRIGLNLRCDYRDNPTAPLSRAEEKNMIHPTDRYIEGLKALKPLNPDRIIFAAIVGIPQNLEGDAAKPEAILVHPDMAFRPDPNAGTGGDPTENTTPATPVCVDLEEGNPEPVTSAVPGRRFVRVAQGFGDNGVLRSICDKSYGPALDAILEKISSKLKGGCLPRTLSPNAEGIVECDVVEILGPNSNQTSCDANRGRVFLEMRDVMNNQKCSTPSEQCRAVCKINQVAIDDSTTPPSFKPSPEALPEVPNPLTGWYYDYFSDAVDECEETQKQRISFISNGNDPESAKPKGTTIRFECFQPVARSDADARGKDAVNSPCPMGNECQERSDTPDLVASGRGFPLVCSAEETCQIQCEVDANCPASWVCETGTGYCVNPTCPPPTLK